MALCPVYLAVCHGKPTQPRHHLDRAKNIHLRSVHAVAYHDCHQSYLLLRSQFVQPKFIQCQRRKEEKADFPLLKTLLNNFTTLLGRRLRCSFGLMSQASFKPLMGERIELEDLDFSQPSRKSIDLTEAEKSLVESAPRSTKCRRPGDSTETLSQIQ